MAVRAAFSMGIDLAGADRLMVLNKISIIMPLPDELRRAGPGDRRGQGRHARELVRRLLPGDEERSSRTWRSTPESWLRMYPEFVVPEDQKKAWLADRQGAIVGADTGEAVRLEGRRPRSAAGDDLPPARRHARGSSTSPASTTRR